MYRKFFTGVLFLAIFMVFSVTAVPAKAQTIPTPAERAALIAQINFLLETIQLLQAQLEARTEKTPYTYRSNDNYVIIDTFYYGKDFEAIYEIDRDLNLIRRDKTTAPRELDEKLWEMFVDTVGDQAARRYITEFRVFNNKESSLGGFIELPAGEDKWIVGFNRDDFKPGNDLSRQIYTVLMLHEYAHLQTFYMKDFVENFADRFWTTADKRHAKKITELSGAEIDQKLQNYYQNHQNDFVSDYATYSFDEDVAETFVDFILEDKPTSDYRKKDAKILYMYKNRELLELRSELRRNLGL